MKKSDIIKNLKNKEDAHACGICSPEAQVIYSEAGLENCEVLGLEFAAWEQATGRFWPGRTYAIKSDWQPESEYATRKVRIGLGGFCVVEIPDRDADLNVMVAAGHKDFVNYYRMRDDEEFFIPPYGVTTSIVRGAEVFGRFRKKTGIR